jgi:hypothetical protein
LALRSSGSQRLGLGEIQAGLGALLRRQGRPFGHAAVQAGLLAGGMVG